jgi:hypothetical protein
MLPALKTGKNTGIHLIIIDFCFNYQPKKLVDTMKYPVTSGVINRISDKG